MTDATGDGVAVGETVAVAVGSSVGVRDGVGDGVREGDGDGVGVAVIGLPPTVRVILA